MTAVAWAGIAVVSANLFALILIYARSRVYGIGLYRPMVINIILSVLPVLAAIGLVVGVVLLAIAVGVTGPATPVLIWIFLIAAAGVWLLFFPNSAYLITELNFSHRRDDDPVPLWFDIVQTLSLTVSGLVNAVASLGIIQFAVWVLIDDDADATPALSWAFAGFALILGALGVYLGRYLRFNSWDVRHPSSMIAKSRAYFAQRGKKLDIFGFVLTHAILLAVLYVPIFGIASLTFR